MDRGVKQLHLSHENEGTCKLLYKKFFTKNDCTILHGGWKKLLLGQNNQLNDNANIAVSVSEDTITPGGVIRRITPPRPKLVSPLNLSNLPVSVSPNASPVLSRLSESFLTPRSNESTAPKANERKRLVSSSRHGVISPSGLEPFQCLVLFYPSSYALPRSLKTSLAKVFGPSLAPRIEAYIRDECNGEQVPGTSFILETEYRPCRFVVCTSIARNLNCLSQDYAYNAFRSALLSIHNYNRAHREDQINSILCPAFECITTQTYNMVHQMATCYKYWDWHMYARGAVLPLTHEDEENINKQIKITSPSIARMARDLSNFIRGNILAQRGLVYDSELQILLEWLNSSAVSSKDKRKSKKLVEPICSVQSNHPTQVLAQVLVDLLKRPDVPPFTLTPAQICAGIAGSIDLIMRLGVEYNLKIYDEIQPKDLTIGRTIAQGAVGKVTKATWGTKEVAVKIFMEHHPQTFLDELTLITLVRHPKLVECIGGYLDKHNAYIVTELMDMSLFQLIQRNSSMLTYPTKLRVAADVAEAMEFLHSRNITHRDLKSLNIVLSLDTMSAKLCDFGLSRVIDCTSTMTGNVGTTPWMAPEILQDKRYTEKCDVYSFGVVLYELITHLLPFKDTNPFKIADKILKGDRPTIPQDIAVTAPKEYLDLMKQCWHDNPQKRPSFTVILAKLRSMIPPDTFPSGSIRSDFTEDESTYISDTESNGDEDDISDGTYAEIQAHEAEAFKELKTMLKRVESPLITEELLLKCIRACRCKTTSAKNLVLRYIEWYQLLNSGKVIKISDVRKTLESKVLYYVEGARDIEGRNIIFWNLSNYDVDVIPEPALIKTFVYCLERATETLESQTNGIVLVANLSNWNTTRVPMRVINSFFGTLKKYFPVNVSKILFLNAPGRFSKVLTMYQSFINAMMDRIEMVNQQKLLEYITEDNLVPGVNGNFHFDMDLWIRTRHIVEGMEYN